MIAAVENGMLARLKAAADAGALGYAWRTLETYPADWDAYFKNKPQLNAPAAWVVFGGVERVERSNDGPIATCSFGLVVAATNLRNEEATRHGRTVPSGRTPEPGSYQLMLDAVGLLDDQDLGLDIAPLAFVEAREVVAASAAALRNASVWALRFRTDILFARLALDQDALVDFELFHANWDVPGFGGIDAAPGTPGVQIPDDAHADATDHVGLPQ